MAIKRRRTTAIVGTDGATTTYQKELSLGAAYAKVLKIEIKGDDANVEASQTCVITDAEGRQILTTGSKDFGTDDSAVKATNQVYSTVGLAFFPGGLESDIYDPAGDASADTEGTYAPQIAASPLTFSQTGGTDGDAFQLTVYVEV